MWLFSIKPVEEKPKEAYPNKPSVIPENTSEEFVKPVNISIVTTRDMTKFTDEQIKRIIQVRKVNASAINHNVVSVEVLALKLNSEFGLNKSLRSYQKVWKDWRNTED